MDEFPKWVDSPDGRFVVQNEAEEKAVADGTAVIEVIESAQGSSFKVSLPPPQEKQPEPPKPKKKPVDEPSTRLSRRGRR